MAVTITVPRLGWSMEEGTFVEWLKKDGDAVRPGDAVFVLESDKAAEPVEALDAGILRLKTDGPRPGDKVRVGQVLAFLVRPGEAAPTDVAPVAATVSSASAGPVAGPAVRRLARTLGVDLARVQGSGPGGRITEADVRGQSPAGEKPAAAVRTGRAAVTPRARRAARELGIDPASVRGSGRNGRVRERDVRAAAKTVEAGRLEPHTTIRKLTAARMVAGVTQAAPVTLTARVDASNLVNLRRQFQAAAGPGEAVPSYTDFLVVLAAGALRGHPAILAQWRDEGLFHPETVHVGVAVDTEAGLLAPVLRDADRLSLRQAAARLGELAGRARAGRLTGDEVRGATFTVSNLGMYGVDAFTPILNLPGSAVLGVGRIAREPAVVHEQVVPRDVLTLSLTFDHRVVDGAPAARFLDELRRRIENPAPHLVP